MKTSFAQWRSDRMDLDYEARRGVEYPKTEQDPQILTLWDRMAQLSVLASILKPIHERHQSLLRVQERMHADPWFRERFPDYFRK